MRAFTVAWRASARLTSAAPARASLSVTFVGRCARSVTRRLAKRTVVPASLIAPAAAPVASSLAVTTNAIAPAFVSRALRARDDRRAGVRSGAGADAAPAGAGGDVDATGADGGQVPCVLASLGHWSWVSSPKPSS
jgi:hypothetical protein